MEKSAQRTPARPSSTPSTTPPAFSTVAMENAPRTRATRRAPRPSPRNAEPREARAARGSVYLVVALLGATRKWLRVPSNARTFLVRRDPPAPKAKRAPRARKRGPPGETMRNRAEAFRATLAAEPGMTRADLARRLGVSRAWVTRVLGPAAA